MNKNEKEYDFRIDTAAIVADYNNKKRMQAELAKAMKSFIIDVSGNLRMKAPHQQSKPFVPQEIVNDRLIRERERKQITALSRTQAWSLEKQGLFPKRIQLGSRSVAWRLSEVMEWVNSRERANG